MTFIPPNTSKKKYFRILEIVKNTICRGYSKKKIGVLWEGEKFISGVADREGQHGTVMAIIPDPHFWG